MQNDALDDTEVLHFNQNYVSRATQKGPLA